MAKYEAEIKALIDDLRRADERWEKARESKAVFEITAAATSFLVVAVLFGWTYLVSGQWRDNQ